MGVGAALPVAVWLWGFTVDDALISARVAAHLAQGLGYRFNAHGPVVDAVTPLGYAPLLALLGRGDTWTLFVIAKWLGLGAWLVAAAVLGGLCARAGGRALRFTPLFLVALSVPLAAWSVSGMETGLVTLLATLGLLSGPGAALSLGVAAAWRPELAPFAFALVGLRARTEPSFARRALPCALCVLPVLCVALTRLHYFGRALPLSFYAKPSDLEHGWAYASGAFEFAGLPWLVVAGPYEWRRASPKARPLIAAILSHFIAIFLCGGDWMAMYRLLVPVLPCIALAAAYLAEQATWPLTAVRAVLSCLASLLLGWGLAPAARQVGADRARLIAAARPVLVADARIAALDVGWVGAASNADVIDLAGVTDPEAAFFPGGHTTKRIPAAWLFAHQPTAIVLLLAPGAELAAPFEDSHFARGVEQHVAQLVAGEFRVRSTLDLRADKYVVLEPLPER
ncbi:MAG: hypothetical protein ABI627_26730 [Polyangiaceae bacterium]